MDRSPYLVAALNSLQNQPQMAQPAVDVQGLVALGRKAQDYEGKNPGSNFLGHQLMQAGRNVVAIPGNVVSGLRRFADTLPGASAPPPSF